MNLFKAAMVSVVILGSVASSFATRDFGNLDSCYPAEFKMYQTFAYPSGLQTNLLRAGKMEEFTWTECGDRVTVFRQAPSIPAGYRDSGKTHRLKGTFRSGDGREVRLIAHLLEPVRGSKIGCYIMVDESTSDDSDETC